MLKLSLLLLIVLCFAAASQARQPSPDLDAYLESTLTHALETRDADLRKWRQRYENIPAAEEENMMQLLGYQPPDFLIDIAFIAAHLYQRTGEARYAQTTREILLTHGEHRRHYPERFHARKEYERGVPVTQWFRTLPRFVESYQLTLPSGLYKPADEKKVADAVAVSVDVIFNFPEWGAMNRTLLRAESLMAAALGFPDHPRAATWRKMAEILAGDSLEKWEIEDASIYHAIWLRPYINYLDLTGRQHLFHSPMLRFYFEYVVSLITPDRRVPEFGDGRWDFSPNEYYLAMERAAREYQSGEMKWAAEALWTHVSRNGTAFDSPNRGFARLLIERERSRDPELQPVEPRFGSGDALEEVVSKKIVFRSGWSDDATYLLLNYKDEGYSSIMQKDYLKHVLAVEEEKMHHGHSDENSICLFMHDGAILLNDGSYREVAPSGPYGAFRADIFHNRVVVRNLKKSAGQPLFEVLRNSGAYNEAVRTTKLDFQAFPEVEYARTRLEDAKTGYRWDRTLIYHKAESFFVAVDAIKFLRSDYFTAASLWHTRRIVDQGPNWYVTRIDSIFGKHANPGKKDLLVLFLKTHESGIETERRNRQTELAVSQHVSQFYDAGRVLSFVTILYPLDPGADAREVVQRFKLADGDEGGATVVLSSVAGTQKFGVKLDLDLGLLKEDVRPRYDWSAGKVNYGSTETDADFIFLHERPGVPRYAATNMTRILHDGKILFEASESQFFQVWGRSDRVGRAKWRAWDNYGE